MGVRGLFNTGKPVVGIDGRVGRFELVKIGWGRIGGGVGM